MQDYQLIIKVQKLLGKKCKFEFSSYAKGS